MNRPFARPSKGASRHAAALVVTALLGGHGCGGADAPTDPGLPSPLVSPSPQAGGALVGPYAFEIRPAATCGMGGPVSFPMVAAASTAGGARPYPGVQIVVTGEAETLELEVRSEETSVTGGFGTTERGALAAEAVRVWLHAIGSGGVTRAADGRGQILTGKLAGYVAFGHAGGLEGSLGSCDSPAHSYSLRVR